MPNDPIRSRKSTPPVEIPLAEAKLLKRLRKTPAPGNVLEQHVELLINEGTAEALAVAGDLLARYGVVSEGKFAFEPRAEARLGRARARLAERLGDVRRAAELYLQVATTEDTNMSDVARRLGRVVLDNALVDYYIPALSLIEASAETAFGTSFPSIKFEQRLIAARLASLLGHRETARRHAQLALDEAAKDESVYHNHRSMGLVSLTPGVEGELKSLIDGDARH